MKKFRLFTSPGSMSVAVDADRILTNDVVFDHESNPGKTRLWLCANAHGPMGAVWANSAEDALDKLVDNELAGGILVDPEDVAKMGEEEREHFAFLGNHGEACNLDDTYVEAVTMIPDRDYKLMLKLAEARGAGHDNLDF
jgi:hypothetical protein